MLSLQWQRSWAVHLLYHRSIYKIYFDIFFYLFARLDGRAGDSPVPEVTPTDRPLTHPTSGTSYASSVKKPESSVVPPGKAWESSKQGAPPLSPVCVAPGHVIGSYAAVLKKKGGPQDVSEPLSPSCEIDEILCDPGNNNFQPVFFLSATESTHKECTHCIMQTRVDIGTFLHRERHGYVSKVCLPPSLMSFVFRWFLWEVF